MFLLWITVFDAWGKIPSGILVGNHFDFGSFDECLAVNYNENNSTFVGQYCMAQIMLPDQSARGIPITHATFKPNDKQYRGFRMLPTFDTT